MANELSVKKRISIIVNKLRVEKDGENTFAKYSYFKPEDIFKKLNPLLEEYNLITIFNLKLLDNYYVAELTIEDTETDSKVTYAFDIAKATLKGTNEAQNSGATLTYAKRYSLMNAFNIADNDDDLDAKKPSIVKDVIDPNLISDAQRKRIFTIGKGKEDIIKELIGNYGYDSSKKIKKTDYDNICKELEKIIEILSEGETT